jgi:hypothetical protein
MRKLSLALLVISLTHSSVAAAQDEPLPAPPLEPAPAQPLLAPAPQLAPAQPPPVIVQPVPPPRLVLVHPVPPRNGIHFNPLGIALGVIGIGYERVFGAHISLRLEGQYTRNWYTGNNVWGAGGSLRPYVFFFRPAPGGMYISPFASVAYAQGESGMASARGVGWSVGGTIGYSWLLGRLVNLRAGAGVQYLSMEVSGESTYGQTRIGMKGVLPALDLSLGFVF